MRNITFTAKGWSDLMEWSKTDRKIFNKISDLIEETSKNPFKGKGKPEPLKPNAILNKSRAILV